MSTGIVKWFNDTKGYGFIVPDDGGKDVFVHFGDIIMDGHKTLKDGQHVQFSIRNTEDGRTAAAEVIVID